MHADKDPATLSKEDLEGTGESEWCVFCDNEFTYKRKRNYCNTYEDRKLTQIPKVLRKLKKRFNIASIEKEDLVI